MKMAWYPEGNSLTNSPKYHHTVWLCIAPTSTKYTMKFEFENLACKREKK